MKKILLTYIILVASSQFIRAAPDSVTFLVVRLDYLTCQPKHVYYFQQVYDYSFPELGEDVYHDLFVKISPGDFGETTMRSRTTGELVYQATTIWQDTGKHIFPTSEFEIEISDSSTELKPKFLDYVDFYFVNPTDTVRADTAWQVATKIIPAYILENDNFGALIYLHYFIVAWYGWIETAEWIIIFYSLTEDNEQPWVPISGDLPNLYINSIASHPFFTNSLFIGTDAGAFQSLDGGKHWHKIQFGENPDVKITQIRVEMHPYLAWLEPVLWLGTEEYTMIENLLGRIFFSNDGGANWINTHFPMIAVSALEVLQDSSLVAFGSAYDPFRHLDSFYALNDTSWLEHDLTPNDSTTIRINCIEVDEADPEHIFLATTNGVYFTADGGINWNNIAAHNNSPWVVIPPHHPEMVYAILYQPSNSEGIYRTRDHGRTWERVCWLEHITDTLLPDYSTPGVWYKASKYLDVGVFKSTDDCSTWQSISSGLPEKSVLCLAQDRSDPRRLYAGTTNGIFRYEQSAASVHISDDKAILNADKNYNLPTAYPNPFNSTIQIHFKVEVNTAQVKIEIYNLLGQRIKVLVDDIQSLGDHSIQWDGRDAFGQILPSGIYFCRLQFNREIANTLKLLLIQ